VNKPPEFTLGGLQELELLALFAKGFHVQITRAFYPIFVACWYFSGAYDGLGQPVKGKGLLDIVFHPRAELGVFFLPAQQPGYQISASFLSVAPIVKPSQFDQTVVGDFAWQIVERIAQDVAALPVPVIQCSRPSAIS
jgi:hypothetical protein